MKYEPVDEEDFDWGATAPGDGLFVVNEGNFMYGNASLSFYIPSKRKMENEVFVRANAIKLGDVAQSMVIRGGRAYIAVNNSGIIFVIDTRTFKVVGTVAGLTSPRYIHFLGDTKAYVTDLRAPRITVLNPKTYEITGRIDTRGHTSTEQMVQHGKYVFTNCWSYDNKILVIDSELDQVVDSIEVGFQPTSMAMDKYGKIWTVTSGGGSGGTVPSLYRIDAETRQVEQVFAFKQNDQPLKVCLNGTCDTLYYLNKSVWRLGVTDETLPVRPFLEYPGTIYYGLAVDPVTSEVYVADAIDYVQPGVVYRFTPQALPVDTFRVGISPGAFCFK